MAVAGNIVLIGFSGTGKSTVGRALASRMNRRFLDTDSLVEETAGMTIPEIFARMGEPAFRQMEAAAVRSAAELKGVVIAAGAGATENEETRRILKENCAVVLMTATIETLVGRIDRSEERPLLSRCDPRDLPARMADLLQRRTQAYHEAADLVAESEGPVDQVVAGILSRMPGSFLVAGPSAGRCSTPVQCIEVVTPGGRYDVCAGGNLIPYMARRLAEACGARGRAFIVSNPMVSQLWLADAEAGLRDAGLEVDAALIGDGERHKNLDTVSHLYDALATAHHDRDTVVIALGGGIVGDTAGFAAATFMRGLPLVHVPTTLLAQVDSSVGGKVAVNHPRGKNLIGAFHQPKLVISDVHTLQTLPDRAFSEGMAEVIKTALIGGEGLFGLIERRSGEIASRDPLTLQEVVAGCVRVKAGVVSEDERDTGKRLLLNLGHTFGHALEAACGYDGVSHGQAVAAGTCMAVRLSQALGMAHPDLYGRVSSLIRRFSLPEQASSLRATLDPGKVEEYLASDKKRRRRRLRFVLPVNVGDVRVVEDVPHTLVSDLIRRDLDD
ncbi:MAG: 3-dehydroquinate synthase [Ignavibacteriales bacterium]